MINFKAVLASFLILMPTLITPVEAFAVIQNLNGQTGQTQTFQNDSNIIISSSGNTHTFGWQGLLPLSRGGTGANSFTSGSVLFSNGTTLAQDNSNLFWDNTNKRLGIGTTTPFNTLGVNGNISIGDSDGDGVYRFMGVKIPNTASLEGGFTAGTVDEFSEPRSIELLWQNEADPTQSFGYVSTRSNPLEVSGSEVRLQPAGGPVKIGGNYPYSAVFNASLINNSDKTFTFPDVSGTFGLLEASQTWNGLNKFEADTDSTIYVGSSTKTGCIALGDSDGDGITYVTANDGVLSASSSKPSFCQ